MTQSTDTRPLTAGLLTENPAAAGPAEQAQRVLPDPKPADKHGWWWGTGRRKTAVARVRLRPAQKEAGIKIQLTRKAFKSIDEYFTEIRDRRNALAALEMSDTLDKLEVFVRVHGGGFMGQAEAVRLGVSRALVGYDPSFEPMLRDAGFLTRDDRKVERKKYGLAGARRRFQFSKR